MDKLYLLFAQYQINIAPLPHSAATPAKVAAITRIVFTIIGALALLMFVVGGLRYVASQGDPQATAKAKGTLIYALVGLIVSITSIAIVTLLIGSI